MDSSVTSELYGASAGSSIMTGRARYSSHQTLSVSCGCADHIQDSGIPGHHAESVAPKASVSLGGAPGQSLAGTTTFGASVNAATGAEGAKFALSQVRGRA